MSTVLGGQTFSDASGVGCDPELQISAWRSRLNVSAAGAASKHAQNLRRVAHRNILTQGLRVQSGGLHFH